MTDGIVVCPQPIAAEAALEVLRDGGNAVDAIVAAALVQGVVDPLMCGLGGYGIMQVHDAATGNDQVIDFFSRAPGGIVEGQGPKLQREFEYDYGFILDGEDNEVGYRSVAVPGEVAGLSTALDRFGTRPWRDVLEPAIGVADAGLEVSAALWGTVTAPAGPDKPSSLDRLLATAESRATLTNDGQPYPVGARIDRSDYARSLRRLQANGPRDFYEGELAAAMVADFSANGSAISAEDLKAYPVIVAPATRGAYRNWTLSVPLFPAGGPTVLEALNLLEQLLPGTAPDWFSAPAIGAVADALRMAIEDKYQFFGGQRTDEMHEDVLISKAHAVARVAAARERDAAPVVDSEAADTTHISVIDGAGNAAALTHTLASGSGVITPGLGYMFNNFMHGFDPRPGRWNSLRPNGVRPASMCPTFLYRDDEFVGVAGATGSTRIVSSLVQILSHVVDRGWEPARAVMAPRINCQRNGLIQMEGRFPTSLLTDLERAGRPTERYLKNYDSYFGRTYLLHRAHASAEWVGVADPRGDGGTALSG